MKGYHLSVACPEMAIEYVGATVKVIKVGDLHLGMTVRQVGRPYCLNTTMERSGT